MTEETQKAPEPTSRDKVDPAAAKIDTPRPAPRWKPDPKAEDPEDDDLFNDMPV